MDRLFQQGMELATPNVEGNTRAVVTAAELHVTERSPVLSALRLAMSVATIQNAASHVTNLARPVPRHALGLVHIAENVPCRVRYPVICYRARSGVQRCWPADIDARLFAGRSAHLLHIARYVQIPQSREWSLTLSYRPPLRRLILMKIPASCHHAGTSSP